MKSKYREVFIYGLLNRKTKQYNYIGQTGMLNYREKHHRKKYPKYAYKFVVLETVRPTKKNTNREKFWIKHYKGLGHSLNNVFSGQLIVKRGKLPLRITLAVYSDQEAYFRRVMKIHKLKSFQAGFDFIVRSDMANRRALKAQSMMF